MSAETNHWLAKVNIAFTDRPDCKAEVLIPDHEISNVPVRLTVGNVVWNVEWCPVGDELVGANAQTLREHDEDLYIAADELANFAMYGGPRWYG